MEETSEGINLVHKHVMCHKKLQTMQIYDDKN